MEPGQEEETDIKYYKFGFSTSKMNINELEKVYQAGFANCGSYFWTRVPRTSCCETWQYSVKASDFKMSRS